MDNVVLWNHSLNEMEQEALKVLERLEAKGFLAFFVGGYVRDKLLNRPIQDIDIATSALPEQIAALFPKHIPTGIQHGTITVVMGSYTFEVTTFRTEAHYEDHRRPSSVSYVENVTQDLARRDFTINAIAIDRRWQLVDPFGGRQDLKARLIRAVGNAEHRFEEDALRMMRCIRFAVNYHFEIEEHTYAALRRKRRLLKHIAMERIHIELDKIISGPHPNRGMVLLTETELMKYFKQPLQLSMQGWEQLRTANIQKWLLNLENPLQRWILLFFAGMASSAEALESLKALRCSNQKQSCIVQALRWLHHCEKLEVVSESTVREQFILSVLQYGSDAIHNGIDILQAAPNPVSLSSFLRMVRDRGTKWLEELEVTEIKQLHIDGRALLKAGIPKGPLLGKIMRVLLEQCALGQLANEHEQLVSFAKTYASQYKQGESGR